MRLERLLGGWLLGDCWEGGPGMHLKGSWEVSAGLCGGRCEVLVRLLGRLLRQPVRFLGDSWESPGAQEEVAAAAVEWQRDAQEAVATAAQQ